MTTTADDILRRTPFDNTTGALLMVDTIHHEVHEGEMFHAEHTFATVANGNSVELLMLTSATVETHATWEVLAGGLVTVSLFEAPTIEVVDEVYSEGTPLALYNMKRSAHNTNLPTCYVFYSPTVTDAGPDALVNGRILPGGTSPQTRVGGGIRAGTEWIMASETYYLLRVTNGSGGAISISMVVEWYEEAI